MQHDDEPDPLDVLLGLGRDGNDAIDDDDDEPTTLDDLRLQLAAPNSKMLEHPLYAL